MTEIVKPDYQGGGIVNLMSSLIAGLGGAPGPCPPLDAPLLPPLATARSVVLLVLDGLGDHQLAQLPAASWLRRHRRGRLSSVFPSTTATAVTTFLTGEAPQQHGLTGWHMYFRELGSVLAILPGRPRFGGVPLGQAGVPVGELLGHRPLYDRLSVASHVVSPAHIAHSDFNRAHLGRARLHAYRGLGEMLTTIAAVARDGRERQFVYAYWPELDSIGHSAGAGSPQAHAHLRELDAALAELDEALRGTETLLLITADHGMIDTQAADRLSLDDHPVLADCLALPLCGEPRLAYCYLRSGRDRIFADYVRSALAGVVELRRSHELLAEGWFGPGTPHPRLAERIGDYTLIMQDRYVIKDWLPFEQRYVQVGVHGGLSAAEMYVPLIVASG